jgi:hypothetical protein
MQGFRGLLKKLKSINRKGRKDLTQSSQRFQYQCFAFVCFAQSLARFAVKKTFSTAPWEGL